MKTLSIAHAAPGVVRIDMNRPEVFNAFDETMIGELTDAFQALGADPAVRVLVLAGRGKAFSAGADLQWMRRASLATQAWNLDDARRFADMLWRIESCPKPTIAQVHGLALGGGLGLACACDFTMASRGTEFAASEARFGILPAVIGPYLVNAVGRRHARQLALSASRIGTDTALALGLVQEVLDADRLDLAVLALARELSSCGPQALAEIKTLFGRLAVGEVTDGVRELTAQTISRVRGTDEAREGFAAFFEKRPAAWTRA